MRPDGSYMPTTALSMYSMGKLNSSQRTTPSVMDILPLAESLEQIRREKAHKHQRRGQYAHAQEHSRELHGLPVIQKPPHERRGEALVEQYAHRSYMTSHSPRDRRIMACRRFRLPAA